MAYDASAKPTTKQFKSDYSDEDILSIVDSERARSIGFDLDSDLTEQRESALNYIKGEMEDVPSLPNRSKAVSTDVADAVETIMPDLMDILTGGEDIATFRPTKPQDEKQAEQETDFVLHTVFEENDGFMAIYTMVKDALQVKTGICTFYAEELAAPEPETFRNQTLVAVMMAKQDGELIDLRPAEDQPESSEPLYDYEMARQGPKRKIKVAAVSPDDFTVAADTIRLRDATYCAMRMRPRAQDLLAEGIDPDIVDQLPAFDVLNTTERQARDTVGEHEKWDATGAVFDLRQVEVIAHYVRLLDNNKSVIWRVLTGHSTSVLVKRERVNFIPFAAITPYVVTHRFYGESVADKLMEIQRVNTALTRMGLDGGYFALNQRVEVAIDAANEFTLPDLLRNEPGMPIRSKSGNAIKPVQSGGLTFDAFAAMEHFKVSAEQRTGIMRYGQGMKPDTLHDTMGGAMVQLNGAQKRVRLIARVFAETGIKDLFLGVHALLRENGCPTMAKLRNTWMQVDPTTWGERNDMVVEIGVGSAGREHDQAAMREVIGLQKAAVEGGLMGVVVTPQNIYAAGTKLARVDGIKSPELFFTDPSQQEQKPQEPDPKALALQASAQLDGQKLQLEGEKAQAAAQSDRAKQQLAEVQVQISANAQAHAQAMAERKQQFDEQLALMKLQQERELALAEVDARYATQTDAARIRAEAEGLRVGADLTITAASHSQSLEQAAHEAQHAQDLMAQEHQHAHDLAAHEHANALEQQAVAPEPATPEEPPE